MSYDLATFYNRTRNARKIIVVDLGFLGDTVHLIPALWELKRHYPGAALHVLTSTVGQDVLRLTPWVDHAWGLEMYPDKRTLRQQWETIRPLRAERFDVAFNFSGADRANFATALTRARRRVGCRSGRWHFYNRWLVQEWAPQPEPTLVVFEQRRSLLAACGLNLSPPRFNLQVDASSAKWADSIVPPFAVHLSPSASKPTKEWPLEHQEALLRILWADYSELHVMVSSGGRPRERERVSALETGLQDGRLHVLPLDISIPQLAAVLTRCRLHIGADSGVLHLAVALDVPTISFFRQQGAYESFLPTGPKHHVISMPCHCVDHQDAPCERLGRAECFAQIEPARVAASVRSQLAALVQ